ncbi:MAG: leucine-rich repeat protein, partial [Acutalibacteraceae bacterium]
TSITIPGSVISIGHGAFESCINLTSVTIPDSVTSIGNSAFYCCRSLTSVSIGNGVTSIGNEAFNGCTSLTSINVDENNTKYSSVDGVLFNKNKTVLIQCPAGKTDNNYVVPDSVTNIGDYAFYICRNLKIITIPDSVTSIGNYAFYKCTNLISVSIGNSVTSIGNEAFNGCTSLTSITIPNSVTSIGNFAFEECSNLTSITISDSVKNIGKWAFCCCTNLTTVTIGNGVTNIGNSAFYKCSSLSDVYYRGLLSDWDKIVIGSNNDCLINANISHLCTYGDWVTNSESTCTEEGFRSKKCVVCGDVVTEVLKVTGHNYSKEWTIDKVATCTEAGSKSHHCTVCGDKTDITVIEATGHNYVLSDILSEHPHTITHTCSYCGDEKTEASVTSSCVECNFTITPIDSSSYKLVSYIGTETDVVIPATYNERAITTIAVGCFKDNTEITFIKIGDNVTNIGSLAFMNCSSLENVIIPASVSSIGTQAFYGFTGTIYCVKGSYAYEYAIANGIKYEILGAEVSEEPIQDTKDTTVDYDNSLIYTTVENCSDINEILGLSDSAIAIAKASYIYGNTEFYGTGTVITVFDGSEYVGEFTLVVSGDINGDSVCDVLDCYMSDLAANGHTTLIGVYEMAADSNSDGTVDVNDYQAIVNKAVC